MRYRVLFVFWLLSDLALFIAAYIAAYFLRVGFIFSSDFPIDQHLSTIIIVAPLWLLVLGTTRTFHLMRSQATPRNALYIAYSCLVGVALFTLAYYFRYTAFFSRLLLVEAFVLSAAGIWLWHILFEQILRRLLRKDPPVFPTLIVGVTRESRALIAELNRKKSPLKPVAILDSQGTPETAIDGVPVIGRLHKLEETLTRFHITHMIQASDMEQCLNLLSACRAHAIAYIVLPSVFGLVGRDERVESLEGHPVTVVPARESFWSWFFR